ncbi:unnamed protein product, partial [Mesorhabditis spiculigera]
MFAAISACDPAGADIQTPNQSGNKTRMDCTGQTIKCKALVIWGKKNIKLEEIEVDPPKAGEVRIKMLYNALCHTDIALINGWVVGAKYPCIPGHEATAEVESVGEGVTRLQPGDIVIPTPFPQCNKCKMCTSGKTNLCEEMDLNQLTMPLGDGTTRIKCRGEGVFNGFGIATFSEYSVINPKAPADKACLVGCGIATGYGAAVNTAQVREGDKVAVIGLGCIGLSAVHGAKHAGAAEIIAIDSNPKKFDAAMKMGATKCVNPKDCPEGTEFSEWFTKEHGAMDKSLECVGDVDCMRQAIEIVSKGWGRAVILGVQPPEDKLEISPALLLEGRTVLGGCVGDYHTVDEFPKLVDKLMAGEITPEPMITHHYHLEQFQEAVQQMDKGKCIRAVFELSAH